jgi:single-strand DNA-binding protein
MSTTINKVILLGNLVRNPELNHTKDGSAVCNASVATNSRKVDKAQFTDIVLWNKSAELFAQLAEKGSRVYIEGQLNTISWIDKDNPEIKKLKTEIMVTDFVVLDKQSQDKPSEGFKFSDAVVRPFSKKELEAQNEAKEVQNND